MKAQAGRQRQVLRRALGGLVALLLAVLPQPLAAAPDRPPAPAVAPAPPAGEQPLPVAQLASELVTVLLPREPIRMVLVAKDRQHLWLVELGKSPRVLFDAACATGENPGQKQVRGDERTPVGVYFIVKSYVDNEITVFGRRAFHLDYPNPFDAAVGRGGDGIFIHGTNRDLTPYSTNGCVTVDNADLDVLAPFLRKNVVPVVIVESLVQVEQQRPLPVAMFGPAKGLLLPDEVDRAAVEFDSLYLVRAAGQMVAVGEYLERTPQGMRHGYSRAYLSFFLDRGWLTTQRIWHGPEQQDAVAAGAGPRAEAARIAGLRGGGQPSSGP